MPVKIKFRGVSLFRHQQDHIEVLIPATPEDEGQGRKHHFSRIVVWDPKGPGPTPKHKWYLLLRDGVELTFSAGSGTPQCQTGSAINLKSVPGLALKRKAELYAPDNTVASVILKGGTIAPTAFSRHNNWQFNSQNHPQLAYELEWTIGASTIELHVDGIHVRTLHATELIMIGNRPHRTIDSWHPDHDAMHDPPCNAGQIRDDDFWWIYRLVTNPGSRPVPEATCSDASGKGAGSPTCFMAWWV